jgi:alpha-glucosidase (family GH31 glycosyl hydrolase)
MSSEPMVLDTTMYITCTATSRSAGYIRDLELTHRENLVTHKALIEQNPNKRPFMLSRSNFAGLGRVSAHW